MVIDSKGNLFIPSQLRTMSQAYYKEEMAIANAGDSLTDETLPFKFDDNPTNSTAPPPAMSVIGIACKQAKLILLPQLTLLLKPVLLYSMHLLNAGVLSILIIPVVQVRIINISI